MSTEKETMKFELSAGSFSVNAAGPDGTPKRTVEGVAVEWNTIATVSSGQRVKFLPGSLPTDGPAPKFMLDHSPEKPLGMVFSREDDGERMLFAARVGPGTARDEVLAMAGPGEYYDSVSVGVEPVDYTFGKVGTDDENVMIVKAGRWMELSLLPFGAFATAKVAQVAAAEPEETEEPTPTDSEEEPAVATQETPAVVEAAVPTNVISAQPKREFVLPSAGEFMAAYHIGGDTFANMNKAVAEFTASQRTALQAAAGDVLTTDTPGLLPVPVLGPLVQDLNFLRPVVEAVGARAYPDNGQQKTFVRPTITTHTSVAAQTELTAASATTMVIAANTVSKTTLAGQVTLSQQDISFTSPEAMGLILNDLMGEYMIASDNLASDNLLTAATSSGVWDGTVADLLKSVYDSAVDISNGRNWTPTHMFVSPDVWGQLGQLADTTGRPVFPFIGAGLTGQNALGSASASSWNGTPLGLQLVVDSNFAAKTMVITRVGQGQGDAFEFYESIRGLMSIENPAVLGRTMSFHGFVSTFAAIPGMIRKITQA
jgi:hypothetical protein